MHVHHCHKCGQAVASCADSCPHPDGEPSCTDRECLAPEHQHHYCSLHHHDDEHRVETTNPPKFTVAIAEK